MSTAFLTPPHPHATPVTSPMAYDSKIEGNIIITKLDGSARGGMVAAVRAEIGLPTYYLGRGEKPEDLKRFEAREFVENFFGN